MGMKMNLRLIPCLLILWAMTSPALAQKARVQRTVWSDATQTAGTGDAITLAPSPALAALTDLDTVPPTLTCFVAEAVNTTTVTVAISGLTAKPLYKMNGAITTALAANDLRVGQTVCFVRYVTGDAFQMTTQLGNATAGASTPPPIYFRAAKCVNGSGGPGMNLPLTLAPAPDCIPGTNILSGELTFPDLDGEYSVQDSFKVPTGSSGPTAVNIKWRSAGNSGSVVWQIAGICIADDETMDPAFATAQATTDAIKATPNEVNDAQIPSLTVTSCAAGEIYFFRFFRDRNHASDSITSTTTVKLLSLEFVF